LRDSLGAGGPSIRAKFFRDKCSSVTSVLVLWRLGGLEKRCRSKHSLMMMTLHIAGYQIVMGPAGMIVLAICYAILVLSVAAVVRRILRQGR
jgi:hypothetical protein